MPRRALCTIAILGALFSPAVVSAQTHCLEEDHHAGGESVMHLWTGPQNGYYYHVGKAIEAASKHMPDEIRIHTCSSNGSATNLEALLKNEADFATCRAMSCINFGTAKFLVRSDARARKNPCAFGS